jgi:hypothetical protein
MVQEPSLAERVAALEKEVADLRRMVIQLTTPSDWLDRVAGIMKDEPEFAEMTRLGAEIRQADRPKDDD